MNNKHLFALSAAATLVCSQLPAIVLDFNAGLVHGQIIDDEFVSQGVSVSATGGAGYAALYDSRITGGEDPDLEGPNQIGLGSTSGTWRGGNLTNGSTSPALQTGVGNLLMIQEGSAADGTGPGDISDGIVDFPDDNASGTGGSAGTITLSFATGISAFQLDWVDLDEGGLSGYSFQFTDNSQGAPIVTSISFELIVTPGTTVFDPTVTWSGGTLPGDDFANRFPEISVADINAQNATNLNQIDELTVVFGGSGGFANVSYTPVPEPSSYACIIGLAIAGLIGSRRKSRVS